MFAAVAGTDDLYYGDRDTTDVANLCLTVAKVAIMRRDEAKKAGRDFYACAFVEQAANALNQCHAATLEQLFEAGQLEVDMLAGKATGA